MQDRGHRLFLQGDILILGSLRTGADVGWGVLPSGSQAPQLPICLQLCVSCSPSPPGTCSPAGYCALQPPTSERRGLAEPPDFSACKNELD